MISLRMVTEGLRFPEGPVWCADGSVILVEIARGRITRVAKDGTRTTIAEPGGGPNGIAVGPDGALYVCNNGGFRWTEQDGLLRPVAQADDYSFGRIERIDPATGATSVLYRECDGHALRGPNDIVFAADGSFWFTDLGKTRERDRDHGGVYWARADGSEIREVAHPVLTPNGIGLSPDGATLYVAETETSRLWAFDITGPGTLRKQPFPSPHGGRLVCGLPGFQRFDSLKVDAAGNIWMATLATGRITVIAPDGKVLHALEMPETYPTNLCFGGPDLRTVFVTLSGTGRLAAFDWPTPGLRLAFNI